MMRRSSLIVGEDAGDPIVLEDEVLDTGGNGGSWGVIIGFTLSATISVCSPTGTLCGGCNWGTAGNC